MKPPPVDGPAAIGGEETVEGVVTTTLPAVGILATEGVPPPPPPSPPPPPPPASALEPPQPEQYYSQGGAYLYYPQEGAQPQYTAVSPHLTPNNSSACAWQHLIWGRPNSPV